MEGDYNLKNESTELIMNICQANSKIELSEKAKNIEVVWLYYFISFENKGLNRFFVKFEDKLSQYS